MEKNSSSSSKKQAKSSPSSSSSPSTYISDDSFIATIFGSESSRSGSSSRVVGSIFGPSSKEGARDGQASNVKHGGNGKGSKGEIIKNKSYYCEQRPEEIPLYSDSIYYGGQDFYPLPSDKSTHSTYKEEDDVNYVDTRGNWWQGSYHY